VLDEAVRDVCRARTDATDDLTRAKQRLNAFLLRNGFHYTGKAKWTIAHMRYLRELTMPSDPQRIVLEESIQRQTCGTAEIGFPERSEQETLPAVATTDLLCFCYLLLSP
jgi:hypothetical protein